MARDLTEGEAAYLAGIIDGEGSICWYKQRRGRDQPMLIIVSTTPELMGWLVDIAGAVREKARSDIGSKTCWHWRCGRTSDVLALLEAVEPYLIVKREKARAMREELAERMAARV
jgi:hypothetical protein